MNYSFVIKLAMEVVWSTK